MLYNEQWEKQDEVSRILNKAADLLEQNGHVKQTLLDHKGSMCALGALNKAATNDALASWSSVTPVIDAARRINSCIPQLNLRWGYDPIDPDHRCVLNMVEWNNAPERTGQEVIDAFRLAARLPADVVRS